MKKFFKVFIFSIFWAITISNVSAKETVAVFSANIEKPSAFYHSYAEVNNFIAQDIVNRIRKSNSFYSYMIYDAKNVLAQNSLAQRYRYSYAIDYEALEYVNKEKKSKYILLVSSDLDTQTYLMKGTFWGWLNVPGVDVISPKYNLITYCSLVDMDKQIIVWENIYEHLVGADYFATVTSNLSANLLLKKELKKYSTKLAERVASAVEMNILYPSLMIKVKDDIKGGVGGFINTIEKKLPKKNSSDKKEEKIKVESL